MLWNIDLTLVDVARVSRAAYAEAFEQVTGRPLVSLPVLAGASDSEIFFDSLALNEPPPGQRDTGNGDLLARYSSALAAAFGSRSAALASQGRLMAGAREALAATAALPATVSSVLTGAIRPNALRKLHAFSLDRYVDTEVGGFGSDPFPKGTLIVRSCDLAARKYGAEPAGLATVYVADSARDAQAARIGGVRFAGVATGRSTAAQLRDAGADAVLEDLSDTAAVLAAISRLAPVG